MSVQQSLQTLHTPEVVRHDALYREPKDPGVQQRSAASMEERLSIPGIRLEEAREAEILPT